MEEKNIEDRENLLKAKKKLAMIFAGIITFFIFCGWLVYFLQNARKISVDSKGGFGSFIEDIKKNTGESFSEIKNATGEIGDKVKSIGDYYTSGAMDSSTSTEEAINNQ